jgi:hypothetical protein
MSYVSASIWHVALNFSIDMICRWLTLKEERRLMVTESGVLRAAEYLGLRGTGWQVK